MASREPRRPSHPGDLTPFEVELAQEKAANLGRLGQRLDRALAALRSWDARSADAASAGGEARARLLVEAGDALFLYVVQREAMGLPGTAVALDELGVPREVRLRMAPRSVLLRRLASEGVDRRRPPISLP